MSIFGTIMSKIFGDGHAAAAPAAPPADSSAAPPTTTAEEKTGKSNTWQDAPTSQNAASGNAPAAGSTAPSTAPSSVDVAEVLDGMEGSAGETLDWRHSIVDLMKLLHMDSSLTARKELAGELHYTGDTGDSASMNMWLHKEVMTKLAENGGKLPADMH